MSFGQSIPLTGGWIGPQWISCGDKPHSRSLESLPDSHKRTAKYRPTVLVVDDEMLVADTIAEILNRSGFAAAVTYSSESALEQAALHCPDLVLTDVVMPGLNGLEMAKILQQRCARTKILLLSGQASTEVLMQKAQSEGFIFQLLPKPLHPDELLAILDRLGF